VAAAKDWEPRDDYMLFALATTLGETSRVLDALAETTFSHSATTLRARLKRLKGEGDEKGAEKTDDAEKNEAKRSSSAETLAETYARALEAVRSGVTSNAEYRAAAARVAARASVSSRAGGDSGGALAEAPAALALVPKHDPEYSDADLDDGRDAPGTGTGTGTGSTGRPSNLGVARKHAASAAARERVATWSLTAWRFLVRSGDAPEILLPDADPNATTSEKNKRFCSTTKGSTRVWTRSSRCSACGATCTTATCTAAAIRITSRSAGTSPPRKSGGPAAARRRPRRGKTGKRRRTPTESTESRRSRNRTTARRTHRRRARRGRAGGSS
jgi:hypothetical protein